MRVFIVYIQAYTCKVHTYMYVYMYTHVYYALPALSTASMYNTCIRVLNDMHRHVEYIHTLTFMMMTGGIQ